MRYATEHVPDAIGNIPLHGSTKTMSTANPQDHWQIRWLPTYAPPMPVSPRTESTTEVFAGLVERVTFYDEDSGFCVLRVSTYGIPSVAYTYSIKSRDSGGDEGSIF